MLQCEGYDRARDPVNPPRCTRTARFFVSIEPAAGDALARFDDNAPLALCDACLAAYREHNAARIAGVTPISKAAMQEAA
ncbi:MAG: hypothetical protein JXB47_09140 [Anaerolineae bacterium]|nr:hypothetical protein [Anaerolineae bacterium]